MQFYDVSQQSLVKSGSSVVEEYIPLWMADGGNITSGNVTNLGLAFIGDGSSIPVSSSASSAKLHKLSANWPPSQQFAFEATLYNQGMYTASAQLWDMTSNTAVSNSSLSVNGSTAQAVRSGKFTLTPGHSYGVTMATNNSNQGAYLVDASLIVFG